VNSSFSLSRLLPQNVTVLHRRSLSGTFRNSENEMEVTEYTFLGLWEIPIWNSEADVCLFVCFFLVCI
jgi:disulfide bond formation protein DsbB